MLLSPPIYDPWITGRDLKIFLDLVARPGGVPKFVHLLLAVGALPVLPPILPIGGLPATIDATLVAPMRLVAVVGNRPQLGQDGIRERHGLPGHLHNIIGRWVLLTHHLLPGIRQGPDNMRVIDSQKWLHHLAQDSHLGGPIGKGLHSLRPDGDIGLID
jgi:hypothetical protein